MKEQREFDWKASSAVQVLALCSLWVIASIAGRFFIETPNFKPVMAVAILAGFLLRDIRLAILLPVLMMAATDFVFGGYELPVMLAVYFCVALPALFSRLVPAKTLLHKWGSANLLAIASAVSFYVVVNFAVWAFTAWYSKDLAGLVACYVAAIPFLNWMVLGNLFFVNSLAVASLQVLQFVRVRESKGQVQKAC